MKKVLMSFKTRRNKWPFRLKKMFYYLMLMYLFLYQCSHQIKFILPFMEERTHESLHSFSLSVCLCVCASCPTLCDSIDCSLLGSTVHEIFQARILEWVAISFSRGSSQPRDGSPVSLVSPESDSLPRWVLYHCTTMDQKEWGCDIWNRLVGPSEYHTNWSKSKADITQYHLCGICGI